MKIKARLKCPSVWRYSALLIVMVKMPGFGINLRAAGQTHPSTFDISFVVSDSRQIPVGA